MRYLFTLLSIIVVGVSCRNQDGVLPLDSPVSSLADLPAAYQPVQGESGSAVAGRLKSEGQSGKPSGEWRYNGQGQLIEWRIFLLSELTSSDQYRYDREGNLRFVQHFDNNCGFSSVSNCTGPLEWRSYDELSTDADGRITESRTYLKLNGNWDYRSRSTYAYNAQGQMITLMRYNDKQVLTLTQTLTYDARGNVIAIREQSTTASPEYADRVFRYEYDTGRNPYRNTVYFVSALFLSTNTQLAPGLTYEYRSDGLPIRIQQGGGEWELTYY